MMKVFHFTYIIIPSLQLLLFLYSSSCFKILNKSGRRILSARRNANKLYYPRSSPISTTTIIAASLPVPYDDIFDESALGNDTAKRARKKSATTLQGSNKVRKKRRKHTAIASLQNKTAAMTNVADNDNPRTFSAAGRISTITPTAVAVPDVISYRAPTSQNVTTYIRFSLSFQRYILFHNPLPLRKDDNNNYSGISMLGKLPVLVRHPYVIGSFKFLDDALSSLRNNNNYNNTNIVMLNSQATKEYFHTISSLDEKWTLQSSHNSQYASTTYSHTARDKDQVLRYSTTTANNNTYSKSTNETYFQNLLKQLASLVQPIHPITKQPYFTLDETRRQLGQMIPRHRFFQSSSSNLTKKYEAVMALFTRYYRSNTSSVFADDDKLHPGLCFSPSEAQEVISTFPHVVLYDIHEVEERINVMTLPLPPPDQLKLILRNSENEKNNYQRRIKEDEIDWPLLSLRRGYGAGFTLQQATECIRAVPELLALYYDDAKKPTIPYFYTNWKITPADADVARYSIIDGMVGCSASDSYCFAFMHKILGISWTSINIMIQALPSTIVCDTVPWELLMVDGGNTHRATAGGRAGELKFNALNFLRQRLQVSPTDVYFMIKTHSRLGGYEVETNMKPTLDDIQLHLGLSCTELRKITLRMPSLIGMKTADVDSRNESATFFRKLLFFQENLGMSLAQIRSAVIKQPALLQYSVEDNLLPKLEFFTKELAIDRNRLAKMITVSPSILGLSLRRNLRPKVNALMDECSISAEDVGIIISTASPILLLSVARKILPTLRFIESALLLQGRSTYNKVELGNLILKAPRILLHSVETSLAPKIKLLEGALRQRKYEQQSSLNIDINMMGPTDRDVNGDDSARLIAASIMKSNPALLLTSRYQLEDRLNRILEEAKPPSPEASLWERLLPTDRGRRKLHTAHLKRKNDDDNFFPTIGNSTANLVEPLIRADGNIAAKSDTVCITLLVLGRVHPSDNPNGVRGVRKSDGITVSLVSFTSPQENDNGLASRLRSAANACYGTILPEENNLTNYENGLVCIGASVLRPSRRRCDLYSCHAGLKICLQLLKHSAIAAGERYFTRKVIIEIFTDSQYALDLLKIPQQLDRWANQKSISEFANTYQKTKREGNDEALPPLHFVNSDILFPLCQTYKRLKDGKYSKNTYEQFSDTEGQLWGKVSVEFRHVGDKDSPFLLNQHYRKYLSNATRVANEAAVWQYNRAKHAGQINERMR